MNCQSLKRRGDLVDLIESNFEWSERAIGSDQVGQGKSDRDREQNDFGESYFEQLGSELALSEFVEGLTETRIDRSESVGCAIEP